MGIPLGLYTPIFAVSRISGWTGLILEQCADNKLIRPRAEHRPARYSSLVDQQAVIELSAQFTQDLSEAKKHGQVPRISDGLYDA